MPRVSSKFRGFENVCFYDSDGDEINESDVEFTDDEGECSKEHLIDHKCVVGRSCPEMQVHRWKTSFDTGKMDLVVAFCVAVGAFDLTDAPILSTKYGMIGFYCLNIANNRLHQIVEGKMTPMISHDMKRTNLPEGSVGFLYVKFGKTE